MKHRLLIADDHALVVEGFRRILEPHFDILGTAANGREAVEKTLTARPDVVLMDISMPLLNGIDAAAQIRTRAPETRVLFLSMHADPIYVERAVDVGAAGFLLKRSAGGELRKAIEEVMRGRFYLTPLMADAMGEPLVSSSRARNDKSRQVPGELYRSLTPRQREVLQLVAEGKALKEIADVLGVSTKTVEFHKSRIMDRLGVRTTAELTQFAMRRGLVSPD